VREAKGTQQIKAIAITGRTSDEERDQGLGAGFDYYLTKPIDLQKLRQALKS
jgi:CheY-like chemotaxis protein